MNFSRSRFLVALTLGLLGAVSLRPVALAQQSASSGERPSGAGVGVAGALRVVSEDVLSPKSWTNTALPDGTVLMVGGTISSKAARGKGDSPADMVRGWLEQDDTESTEPVRRPPRLWGAKVSGWPQPPEPPACQDKDEYLMPNATLLKDGRVFFSGGLCHSHGLAYLSRRLDEHLGTAIWDASQQRWQPGPKLKRERVMHSATLLPDGSVMLAGGLSRAALTKGEAEPVHDSVELFVDGKIQFLAPLSLARAGHTATLLLDGSVLVVGGYDAKGRALASAELWDPKTKEWSPMPAMADARFSHSATRLSDGRVLVTGGQIGTQLILARSEIFDPSTGRWSDGPALPRALREHSTILLPDGAVLLAGGRQAGPSPATDAWVWLLDARQEHWQSAGNATVAVYQDWLGGQEPQLLPDGRVRIFAGSHLLMWERVAPNSLPPAPIWSKTPAITLLANGQVLVVGRRRGLRGEETGANLWDPTTQIWSDAGRLSYRGHADTALMQLPSGRVILVGAETQNSLSAECWEPSAMQWTYCGQSIFSRSALGHLELGLLPDGRMLVIPSFDDGLVYNEEKKNFDIGKLNWDVDRNFYGLPWLSKTSIAFFDDRSGNAPVDISPLAARYWEMVEETSGYAALPRFREVPGRRLRWDPSKARWAYELRPEQIGRQAVLTPDGCLLSVNPLSLFDVNIGRRRSIVDPGLAMDPVRRRMIQLPGGYVVVVGVPVGGAGRSFYYGRASCAGLTLATDQAPGMQPRDVGEEHSVMPMAAGTLPEPTPRSWWQRLEEGWFSEQLWLAAAVLIPLAIYFMWRWLIRLVLGKRRSG